MKGFLINPRSLADVLYWDAFKGINFYITELFPFKGSLVGFSGEPVQVLGHWPMMTTFSNGENAKNILVRYLINNDASPYNVIMGRPSLNYLEEMFSTMYFTLKYPLKYGRVGIIKGDQGISRKCYKDSLKLKKKSHADESVNDDQVKFNLVDIDPMEDPIKDSLTPIKDLKTVQIGAQSS